MKKVIFVVKYLANFFEIHVNKRCVKRTKNLGRCIIYIAQYIIDARIQNYDIYCNDRGRQILIKDFNAETVYDFTKDKKDSILSFGEYESDNEEFFDDEDENEDDFEYERRSSRFRDGRNSQLRSSKTYKYTPKDNSYDLEVLKENLKNLLG